MSKKNDMSNLKNLGAGILDSLNGIKEEESINSIDENNKIIKNEKSNSVNSYNSNSALEDKSISNKVNNNKSLKEEKSKRSFMLTESAIKKLSLLKLCMTDKDLSGIVEESINMYFEKNKKSLEELISIYESVK